MKPIYFFIYTFLTVTSAQWMVTTTFHGPKCERGQEVIVQSSLLLDCVEQECKELDSGFSMHRKCTTKPAPAPPAFTHLESFLEADCSGDKKGITAVRPEICFPDGIQRVHSQLQGRDGTDFTNVPRMD